MIAHDKALTLLRQQVEREAKTGQAYSVPGLLASVLAHWEAKIAAAQFCEELQTETPPKPKRRKRR